MLPLRAVLPAFTREKNAQCLKMDNKCCHIVFLGSFDIMLLMVIVFCFALRAALVHVNYEFIHYKYILSSICAVLKK